MKKIMITVALAAVTLGANAQYVLSDPDNYDDDYEEVNNGASDWFTTAMLENNYSSFELENMIKYSLKNTGNTANKNPFVGTYMALFNSGVMHSRWDMERMLTILHSQFPAEVEKAKAKVDEESIWDF